MAQYVFTMNRVGKIVPPKRQILKDISLSFFPGAKIGVLGINGSGKSTLLKIMAGLDKEIEGEATPMPGLKIGYLPQEPQLDARPDRARGGGAGHRRRAGRQEAAGRGLRRIRRARTPTSTSWPPSRPSWKPSSPLPAARTPTCSWNSPPTRCACRPGTPPSACRAARSAAWRCAACC
jgi:energy-coupling factor transporter ATP-binding protein EcfA2